MKAYVGVTDGDWYRYLAGTRADEVNFWRPSGARHFRALQHGEPFFFKLHAPDNRIVGGGFFSGFAALRVSEAWRFFGDRNGAATLDEVRTRIAKYRRHPVAAADDPDIGCVCIRDVRFAEPGELGAAPPDFAGPIVQGKGYDLDDPRYVEYFAPLLRRLAGPAAAPFDTSWSLDGDMFGDLRLVAPRLGQDSFRAVVLSTYGGRCAVTGDKIRPVLEAAHVRPVTKGGEHRIDNGILLRSDVHTLFDAGYLGVDPKHRLRVSPRLRDEFGNGEEFYARAETREPITLPARPTERPNKEFLEWHLDEVFKAN